ncbi:TPA: thermosome subunit, partial [Candidatus Woesearchaeota archaeon]|nr:thermosome subunit [Candidatus Woesearchaeota archaeon]
RNLRLFATSLSGREQLAVLAFADAMEIIPITLAENAGLDPIDVLTDLKVAHDKGVKWAGIDVFTGRIIDAWDEGIIEPLKIKTQAVSSASEVAEMILRIDDVIAAGKGQSTQNMPDMEME